ncbi:MAG: site-specific DNA-methyltransferase, partial [Magnetococcales bacterium]|nr:site-specific DNA-methyltransferase [Magnetococcales bacterium]
MARKGADKTLEVDALTHKEAHRRNIPTAEFQSVMKRDEHNPIRIAYERRNRDLDPQLVWRGKDEQDWSDLVVHAPPLYIQEKVHPKVLVEDLRRESAARAKKDESQQPGFQFDLFSDFNGLPKEAIATDFYRHDGHWTNRMILGDSLQVMASLAEREGLRGQVQCIYIDPPYGIKFNSNFQWSTTSRDVKDGNKDHISREPEQVKAFRDTWRDGIHSYLTYLRDRLTLARDLLTDSGSIFVQIGDENVHRVRSILDEIFGDENFVSIIQVQKTGSQSANLLANTVDFILWYANHRECIKYRQLYNKRTVGHVSSDRYDQIELQDGTERRLTRGEIERTSSNIDGKIFQHTSLISSGQASSEQEFNFQHKIYKPGTGNHWKTTLAGLGRLSRAGRIASGISTLRYKRFLEDFSVLPITDRWESMQIGVGLIYVVQTSPSIVERCLLMTTDPGDLVLDPTCGSGTTAYVAEQWGRRWITIDTSRVALALARARIMGARYPYYLLADSLEGKEKEAGLRSPPYSRTGKGTMTAVLLEENSIREEEPPDADLQVHGDLRQGFVYERVPHITLKSIANNPIIDVIWERHQETLDPLRQELNAALGQHWEEWEIPREADGEWSETAQKIHEQWWKGRIKRQREIDHCITAKAEFEYLYDQPHVVKSKVRVAGPFTVESLSPHRVLIVDQEDHLKDPSRVPYPELLDFAAVILEHLRTAGIQQAHKENRILFTALTGWPGRLICAEGRYMEEEKERRAGILIGPEFGTVSRPDLISAAREAGDAGFDVLIACAFNFDAHSAEFDRLGRIPVLKARMNADLHMADDLKNTGKGN